MSFKIIGLVVYSFINVFAFLVILNRITKINHNHFFIVVCFGIEIIIPFITEFLGDILSFSSSILSNLLSFFLPLFMFWYFYRVEELKKYLSVFLTFFLYLSINSSTTFFSVIVSSILKDDFVNQYMGLFLTCINLMSLLFMMKIIDFFDFRIDYLKRSFFKSQILLISSLYAINWIFLNISNWLGNIKYFNSFSNMVATICFLMFLSTLFIFQESRDKYEKEEQLRQKEKEQLRLQEYTNEIVNLYNEIKGFRHDYAGMLTSLHMAIQTGNISEVERIYQEVLVDANLNLRSDKYTVFELNNVGDSALRSVMTETIFKAREYHINLIFEVKEKIGKFPIKLLDIVRISSILLNNAIEGASESKERIVHISLVNLDTKIIFIVKNSRKFETIDLEDIYQIGFSTKGHNRGLGLNNIKEILDRYDFITLDTEIDESTFTQILTIRR